MARTSLRTRVAAIIGGAAIAATGTLALAPAAHAANGDATVTMPTPALYVDMANQTYGTITIKEKTAGIFADNTAICLTFDQASISFNTAAPQPTVADDNATGTVASPATFTNDGHANGTIKFTITKASATTAATYTISGVRVDVGATPVNAITAKAGECGSLFQSDIPGGAANVRRIFGSTRYATAQAIADFGRPSAPVFPCDTSKEYVLARGDDFADALSAAYLAGTNKVPVLLTATGSLPLETIAEMKTLGVQHLDVIGGSGAISDNVVNYITDPTKVAPYDCSGNQVSGHITVTRVEGADRYQTAKAVVTHVLAGTGTVGTADLGLSGTSCDAEKTAIVALGTNFPDALSAGPLAYGGMHGCGSGPIPLLLTDGSTTLSPATSSVLQDQGIRQVILMGGTAAITTQTETQIKNVGGTGNITVVRVFGNTRQGTAAKLASQVLADQNLGKYNSTVVFLSRPDDFADALAAAALAGHDQAPIFLADSTTSLGTTASDGIKGYAGANQFTEGDLLGGTAALSDAVKASLSAAITGQT